MKPQKIMQNPSLKSFLVLKKHSTLLDFLQEHLTAGCLGINWLVFGVTGQPF